MASCPICKQKSSLFLSTKDYNRRITPLSFNYYRCSSCGLIFLFPIPADIDIYYPQNYYSLPGSIKQLVEAAKSERYKIDMIKKYISHGRLLEIGPAFGSFVYLAKEAGFETDAIEMNTDCCTFIRDTIGVRTINSNNPVEALKEVGNYDVIALWHVIEHLPDPWSVLDIISKKLHPGGVLVIAAPNPAALQFRLLSRYWPHVDAPRHVMLFPLELIRSHLISCGLTPFFSTTNDRGGLGWNAFGWQYALSNPFTNRYVKFAMRQLGTVITWAFIPWERKELQGAAYTLIARKGEAT